MATYLTLCQDTASESRTGVFPGTVAGATGRSAKVARWVKQAWIDIQNFQENWRWMEEEYSGSILSGQNAYEGADFSLSRWGQWKHGLEPGTNSDYTTIYKTSLGQADERELRYVRWSDFRVRYNRGSAATQSDYPSVYSIDTQQQLVLWPTPDAAYTIRGVYRKSPQELTDNADEPECPAAYHTVIQWYALLSLAVHDESFNQPPYWNQNYRRVLSELMSDQLPKITNGPALA